MPLTAISFADYLTAPPGIWRDDDSASYKFVQAVKQKPFKGYSIVPVNGIRLRLSQENGLDAVQWFAGMAAAYVQRMNFAQPPTFVPVPNSDCAINNGVVPRTTYQAQQLAARVPGSRVLDCLRWKQVMPSASKDKGSRDPEFLYPNLVLTEFVPADLFCILIDDVKTLGGHLQAARVMLQEVEAKCDLAICAGRTVKVQYPQVFAVHLDEVADWWPASRLY